MATAHATRMGAILFVLAGWLAVLRGLYLTPTSTAPELDLDAGGGFAVNFEVYVPAMVITLLILVMLLVGVVARVIGFAVVAVGSMSWAFALWTLTRNALLDHRPGLTTHLWISIALTGVAISLACLAAMVSRETSSALRPERESARR